MIKFLPRSRLYAILGLLGMLLFFAVLYFITTSRLECKVGNNYMNYSEENGKAVYSSKSGSTKYIVSADRTITYQSGDKIYGTYTVQTLEDASLTRGASGVEIRLDGRLVFRGSYKVSSDENVYLFREDGTNVTNALHCSELILLAEYPNRKLTHCGNWDMWWFGASITLFCLILPLLFMKEETLDMRKCTAIVKLVFIIIACFAAGLCW